MSEAPTWPDAAARAALAAYPPAWRGEPVRVAPQENATYRVEGPGGVSALRLYRPGKWTRAQVAEEHALLARLTPELGPLAPRDASGGATIVTLEDGPGPPRLAALFPWVEGAPPGFFGPAHYRRLGGLFARLHRAAAGLPGPWCRPPVTPDTLLKAPLAALGATPWGERPAAAPYLEDLASATADIRRAWEAAALAPAYLHGDAHRGNLLVRGEALTLIDFDGCGPGPAAYDLAVAYAEARNRPDAAGVLAALLEGYAAAGGPAVTGEQVRLLAWARQLAVLSWTLALPVFPFRGDPDAYALSQVMTLIERAGTWRAPMAV